jgi:uncharacterized protein YuzE
MPKTTKRMIPLVSVITIGPLFLGVGFIAYEIGVNNAIERAYIEAIVIGVIGAIMLGVALLAGAPQRPLVFASYLGGLYGMVGSAIFLFLLSQPWLLGSVSSPWLALILFSLAMIGGVVFNNHYRRMAGQQQANAVVLDVSLYLALIPALKVAPEHSLWSHYDPEADTLAIHFTEPDTPNVASDSDMTDGDVIVRRNEAGEVIGLTIPHASSRRVP